MASYEIRQARAAVEAARRKVLRAAGIPLRREPTTTELVATLLRRFARFMQRPEVVARLKEPPPDREGT